MTEFDFLLFMIGLLVVFCAFDALTGGNPIDSILRGWIEPKPKGPPPLPVPSRAITETFDQDHVKAVATGLEPWQRDFLIAHVLPLGGWQTLTPEQVNHMRDRLGLLATPYHRNNEGHVVETHAISALGWAVARHLKEVRA